MADLEDGDEEESVKVQGPGKPCEGSRKELIKCLKGSECIKVSCKIAIADSS